MYSKFQGIWTDSWLVYQPSPVRDLTIFSLKRSQTTCSKRGTIALEWTLWPSTSSGAETTLSRATTPSGSSAAWAGCSGDDFTLLFRNIKCDISGLITWLILFPRRSWTDSNSFIKTWMILTSSLVALQRRLYPEQLWVGIMCMEERRPKHYSQF